MAKKGQKQNLRKLDPWHELANAIIKTAVSDYREGYKSLYKGRRLKECAQHAGNVEACRKIADKDMPYTNFIAGCLRFFRSGWFRELTEIAPEILIRRLEEERSEYLMRQVAKVRGSGGGEAKCRRGRVTSSEG